MEQQAVQGKQSLIKSLKHLKKKVAPDDLNRDRGVGMLTSKLCLRNILASFLTVISILASTSSAADAKPAIKVITQHYKVTATGASDSNSPAWLSWTTNNWTGNEHDCRYVTVELPGGTQTGLCGQDKIDVRNYLDGACP